MDCSTTFDRTTIVILVSPFAVFFCVSVPFIPGVWSLEFQSRTHLRCLDSCVVERHPEEGVPVAQLPRGGCNTQLYDDRDIQED